jgi:apolipoprotein N-acyltransferase
MLCDIVSFLILFIVCLRLSLLNEIQTHIAILLFGSLVAILLLFLYGHIKKIAQDEEDLEGLV